MKKILIALVFLCPLMGCQSLGFTPPQTTDQRIAYAYSGVTAALNTIAQATNAGTLSSQKADQANQLVLQAKVILDSARASETTDASTAIQDLQLATAAMQAVQQFLTANGVK